MAANNKVNKEERKFILDNLDKISDEEIAKKIGKSLEAVKIVRTRQPVLKTYNDEDSIEQLHAKHYWGEIRKVLIGMEVEYFEKEWLQLMSQFSNAEIVYTDEIQIKDLIITEIFLMRNLSKRKEIITDQNLLRKNLMDEESLPLEDRDLNQVATLRREIASLEGSMQSLDKNQQGYEDRKDSLLKSLKATREARLKQIEERGKNFFGLIKYLNERDTRENEGRWMDLMDKATKKSYEELTQTVQYEDGSLDCPILDPEMIAKEKEEE
jgi:hypothetical protein